MNSGIRLDNLTVFYDRVAAITAVTGSFMPGSLTAVVGPNGAGKTTLLKAIAGILRPCAGHVSRLGDGSGEIAYLPQQAAIDRDFPVTVLDTVLLGHWRRTGPFRAMGRLSRNAAHQALAAMGMAGYEQRLIGALSTGQFQRVLFARVMLQDCPVILLDEPFSALDATTSVDLLAQIRQWHHEGRTIIAVLHNLQQVCDHFPRTLLLHHQVIAWGNTASVMQANRLFEPGAQARTRPVTHAHSYRQSA